MNAAARAMRSAHSDMDVDQVHDMMDDIADNMDVANEISEAISNPIAGAFGDQYDEDELEAELNALDEEMELEAQADLEKQMLDIGPTTSLPEVPRAEPAKPAPAKKTEDPDLAELAAWAS